MVEDEVRRLRVIARDAMIKADRMDELLNTAAHEGLWVDVRKVKLEEGRPYFIRRPGSSRIAMETWQRGWWPEVGRIDEGSGLEVLISPNADEHTTPRDEA